MFASLILVTLMLAMVTSSFDQYDRHPTLRWHVERARAVLLIEADLSPWNWLSLPLQHRYFLWLRRRARWTTAAASPRTASRRARCPRGRSSSRRSTRS